MPRQSRLDIAGVPQHIVQRGNDRQPCFFQDIDHVRYLDELREICLRENCAVHAYVLMTNHVHLLLTPSAQGQIARVMQSLGRRYVRYVNDRYRRSGTLWEGRYKACLVDSETYLLRCHRYIELNPMRAGMKSGVRDNLATPLPTRNCPRHLFADTFSHQEGLHARPACVPKVRARQEETLNRLRPGQDGHSSPPGANGRVVNKAPSEFR